MFKIRKKSRWIYDGSEGGSASYGFATAGSGTFKLNDPAGGTTEFNYASAGAGVGAGLKFSAESSTYRSYDTGEVFLLSALSKDELARTDIEGFCLIAQLGAGAGLGGSATAMFLGIPAAMVPVEVWQNSAIGALQIPPLRAALDAARKHPKLAAGAAYAYAAPLVGPAAALAAYLIHEAKDEPLFDRILDSNAKALLVMAGTNAGPQLTIGASGSLGYVWVKATTPAPPPKPPGPEPIRVTEISINELIIHVPGDVLFDFDKSNLKQQARHTLEQVVKLIQARSPRVISIEGHTDSIGDAKYNVGLSERRARSVAQWLVGRRAATAASMTTRGLGESKPVAPNKKPDGSDDRAGRARNWRVEIYLIK